MTTTTNRPVRDSEDELLAAATSRVPMSALDGLSGVPMERVVLDGERFVVKWMSPDSDWVMRFSNDAACRPVVMWEQGLYDEVSAFVDATVVDACRDATTGRAGLLMRDVSAELLEEGAAPIRHDQQAAFLRDMAAMHAAHLGFAGRPGLSEPRTRFGFFSRVNLAREAARGPLVGVPAMVEPGFAALRALVPRTAELVGALVDQPMPLVAALDETPQTFVHGDWKGGNLGQRADGRTILLDWAFPGTGAPCSDLAWYLAVNCDRLPTTKEECVATYRRELEALLGPLDWFDRQLELALLGSFVQLGWSKCGDAAELAWWVDRVTPVAEELL